MPIPFLKGLVFNQFPNHFTCKELVLRGFDFLLYQACGKFSIPHFSPLTSKLPHHLPFLTTHSHFLSFVFFFPNSFKMFLSLTC